MRFGTAAAARSAVFSLLTLSVLAAVYGQATPPSAPSAPTASAAPSSAAPSAGAHVELPPAPPPMGIPKPGPVTDGPYQPQPILPGGIVMTLFPPGSRYLNVTKIKEAEVYNMHGAVPGRIQSIVNIHNPSIEVHLTDTTINTGAVVILAGGGGHNTLNVGTEGADFVPFLYNYGVNAIILRNRLRRDGYNPQTDEVYDMQQAIRLVRAHAKEWRIDPHKIGVMGFSAGAELVAPAALEYDAFDAANKEASDPLAGITSRPDFAVLVYPGPTPFSRGGRSGAATAGGTNSGPAIPRNMPPSFIVCAGSGDEQHAMWGTEYFTALLAARVPDLEMHIYARGHHPGDPGGPDEPPNTSGGLTDRAANPYGTWQNRFVDWFRDLGFLQGPGVETRSARDVAAFVAAPARRGGGGAGGRRAGRGAGRAGDVGPGIPANP